MSFIEADAPSAEGSFLGSKDIFGRELHGDTTLVPIHLLGFYPQTPVTTITDIAQFQGLGEADANGADVQTFPVQIIEDTVNLHACLFLVIVVGELTHVFGIAGATVVIDDVGGLERPTWEILDLEVLDADAVHEEVIPTADRSLEVDDGSLVGGLAVVILDDAFNLHVDVHTKEFQLSRVLHCLPGNVATVLWL